MKVAFVYPKLGGMLPRIPINLSIYPPAGIMYLAAVCRESGFDVRLFDLTFDRKWHNFEKQIKKYMPDVVGVSSMSPFYDDVLRAVEIAKRVVPQAKIIVGGPHTTANPLEVIKNTHVDVVVVGEAEKIIVPLLQALEGQVELKNVKSIIFKKNGELIKTEREVPIDIDSIPLPAIDLLPTRKKYFRQIPIFPNVPPVGMVIASRGCPFDCSFCQPMLRKIFGSKVRFRKPESILQEIDLLVKKYKVRTILFNDDNLTINKKWLFEICDGIERRGYDLMFWMQGKANTLTQEIAERLKRINVRTVSFGVESGCQRILDNVIGKHLTVDQIKKAFKICEQNNILSCASLMVGSPGENRESVSDTIHLLEKIRPNCIDLHYTAPTPGSRMYDELDYHVSHVDRWSAGAIKLRDITDEELTELFHQIQLSYRQTKKRPPFKFAWDYIWGCMRYGYNFLSLIAQYAYFYLDNSVLLYKVLGRWVYSLKGKH